MTALHHIAFGCRDRDRSAAFYTKHFGFHRAHVHNRGKPGEFVQLRLGGVLLELFPAFDVPEEATAVPATLGFKHFSFSVDDIEAVVAGLRADGVEVEKIVELSHMAPGLRVAFCDDPDGNRIELVEGYDAGAEEGA
jgi:glyoxylase I family protein